MRKVIGLILINISLIGLLSLLFVYIYSDIYNDSQPASERFTALWESDVIKLKKSKSLHDCFKNIKSIEAVAGTSVAKEWLELMNLNQTKISSLLKGSADLSQKSCDLEILLIVLAEKDHYHIVVQYDLTDSQSQDWQWELGRTFSISK